MDNELWNKYADLENAKRHIRDLINGALNRISTTDDETERYHITPLYANIDQYVKLSAEAHEIYKQLHNN